MSTRPLIVLGLFCLAGSTGRAQESALQNDPLATMLAGKASQFLEAVSEGKAPDAYRVLLDGSLLSKQTEALKALVSKTGELETKYGKYRAYERIGMRKVGSDLVLLKYLYKCEQFPVVWYFTFYRTPASSGLPPEDDTWRVIAVRFDTDLDALWY
jgi:hypothetical protein